MAASSYVPFIIFALLWEIAVGIIYGFYFGYQDAHLAVMNVVAGSYPFSSLGVLATQHPFPLIVIALALILVIVGLALVAGYIEKSAATGMGFTLLILAFSIQNYFIFRCFWDKVTVNNASASQWFNGQRYNAINYINYGNNQQTSFAYQSASFLDAIGCALALYAGYTAVIGRIGLTEIFFLTWIGSFLYEVNSQLLWRFFLVDNGYPMRAFAFGGALGITSSLILGKKAQTLNNINFRSTYKQMSLAFLGIAIVWCIYPIFGLANVYTRDNANYGKIVLMMGQVNIWLSLAASVLGCYTASAFTYGKFSVHDMVFSSITGGIAFMASTDINFNPAAALAIGYSTGFICSFAQTKSKRAMNKSGVIDSNSVLFHFIIPSFLASVFSAVLEGVGLTQKSASINGASATYPDLKDVSRSYTVQGGYQIIGWLLSIGFGIGAGLVIGILYKMFNAQGQDGKDDFFNDNSVYGYPDLDNRKMQAAQ